MTNNALNDLRRQWNREPNRIRRRMNEEIGKWVFLKKAKTSLPLEEEVN